MLSKRQIIRAISVAICILAVSAGTASADVPVSVSPEAMAFELSPGQTLTRTVQVHIPVGAMATRVDVYLLADTTYSMDSIIQAMQDDSDQIVDDVMAEWPYVDLAFGVGSYRDFGEDKAFDHQLAPTTDPAQVRAAIDQWDAEGGYDVAEGQFYALDELALDHNPAGGPIGWRDGAKRVLVWFGDAPGHDPICAAISGLGYDIDEARVIANLKAAGVTVLAVSTSQVSLESNTAGQALDSLTAWAYLDHDPRPYSEQYQGYCEIGGSAGQATRIAEATDGRHVLGISSNVIVETIRGIVQDQIADITTLRLVPVGEIASSVTQITPPDYGPLDGTSDIDITFDVLFTGVHPCRAEVLTLSGTLDAMADTTRVGGCSVQITQPPCDAGPEEIPEPTTIVLLLGGLGSMAFWLRRRD